MHTTITNPLKVARPQAAQVRAMIASPLEPHDEDGKVVGDWGIEHWLGQLTREMTD